MKHKFILAVAISLSGSAMAQKSKVLSAYNLQQAYYQSQDCQDLSKARDAIELALTDEKSSIWAKTWLYRGDIYYDIAYPSAADCKTLDDQALFKSHESYMQALEYDEKDKYKKQIDPKLSNVAKLFTMSGINNFNVKNYEGALSDFEKAIQIGDYFGAKDSIALYNACLSAEKIGAYSKAALYYEGLIDIGYKADGGVSLYHQLAMTYYKLEDSTKAFQAIKAGRLAEPSNQDLIIDELNYYLENDQDELALKNLNVAIESMPNDAQLYFAKGTLLDTQGKIEEAEEQYLKAIEIDSENESAIFNLGTMYFNKGVELANKSGEFGENQKAEYEKYKNESEEYFKKALPYFERAFEINPYDPATQSSLKNLYSMMGDEEGYKRVSDILDN